MIDYSIKKIGSTEGKAFIRAHHYAKGSHNGPTCWGLFDGDDLIGVIAFATPCSENVRASIFGSEFKDQVTELHRLVILDGTPKNTESWFISRALKELKKEKPHIWAVVSFADATQGHIGTIYQACNAIYYGTSGKARFFLDQEGRLRHPRQNGVNISDKRGREMGWVPVKREGKHRYLFLLPDSPGHKKDLKRAIRVQSLPYPKKTDERSEAA